MGCCETEEPKENQTTVRTCTDVFWLMLYIAFWFFMVISPILKCVRFRTLCHFQVLIAAFSFVYGNPIRIINGYDSFGNTCGARNKPMSNLDLSGLDMSNKSFLLFFDVKELRHSLKICVEACPRSTLTKPEDIYSYYKITGMSLCEYGFKYSDFKNNAGDKLLSNSFGPCPVLPIYERYIIQ